MSRFVRNTVLLAKIEATYGTDSVPAGATDAILLSNPSFKLNTNNVDRDIVRPYFGASENLVGTKWLETGWESEAVGGGTAGTPPPIGTLIRACAMAEAATATVRTDYTPITDAQESLSMYVYRSGARHKSLGSRGKISLSMKEGEIPKFNFQMMGLYGGIAAATPAGVDFSGFQTPQVVTNTNTVEMKLGSSVNIDALAPVISGGTAYPSLGIELDWGLNVPLTPLIGSETIDVTDRKVTGKITLDLSAADEVTEEGLVLANTLTSLTLSHGTVAGKKMLVYLPRMQLTNPQDTDLNGRLLKTYDLIAVPTLATGGNDEIHIIFF